MPPAEKKSSPTKKKKSPKKKPAIKADYGGLYFGKEEPVNEADALELEDDPLATYRAAASAAQAAAVKERKEEAQLQLCAYSGFEPVPSLVFSHSPQSAAPVSYTHLTLPTILLV